MKAKDLMSKARQAVASAKLLLDSGDADGACNRAYYGMFDAARAALLASGALAELAYRSININTYQATPMSNLFHRNTTGS